MKVVRDNDDIEAKWKEEYYSSPYEIHPREMQRFENEIARRFPDESLDSPIPEMVDKKTRELMPSVKKLASNYQLVLNDTDIEHIAEGISLYEVANNFRLKNTYDEVIRYLFNRVEIILGLLESKPIKVGTQTILQSEVLSADLVGYLVNEMEQYAFNHGVNGLDVYCTMLRIRWFGYDVEHVRWLLNEIKNNYSNTAIKENMFKGFEMRRMARVLHPDGKVEKNGKLMKYLPKNEVLFIVDLMIAAGALKDENDSDDDKYSKYKRFLEVKALMEEAALDMECQKQ